MTLLEERLGDLWAAELSVQSIDLARHRVQLVFSVLRGDKRMFHDVRLEGVSRISIDIAPADWNYAEATEVGIEVTSNGLIFDVVLWDEPNEMSVTCLQVLLDDKLIAAAR